MSFTPPTFACAFECFVGADILNASRTSTVGSEKVKIPNSIGVISSYSVASTTSVNGSCDTALGNPITLTSGFEFSQIEGLSLNYQSSSALKDLITSLGLTGCSPSPVSTIYSPSSPSSPPISSITAVGLNFTASTSRVTPDNRDKIAIGVTIPVVIVVIISLCIGVLLWRHKKSKQGQKPQTDTDAAMPISNRQPYLQHKAELEDEERRKHELEAHEARYEMDGDDEIHEMGSEDGRRRLSRLQELRGPEHSQELEAPSQ